MKRRNVGVEYLVFKEGKNVLALANGQLIFYKGLEEKARWVDTENIYPLTIKLANCKDEAEKKKLNDKIKSSLTYITFQLMCQKEDA